MKPEDGLVLTAAAASCSLGEHRSEILAAMIDDRTAIEDAPAIEGEFQPESPGGPVAKIRAAQVSESAPVVGPVPDRAEKLLNRSIRQALAEAGLDRATIQRMKSEGRRIETVFGTTLGGMRHLGQGLRDGRLEALSRTTTATVTRAALADTGLPLGGSTVSAACASGVSTLAIAATALLADEADLLLAVSYDPISEFAFAGFTCLRLVSEGPLRPFTEDRTGMRLGEGYGVFIVERAKDAKARGATPLARILGWGGASDAHHLTQPAPDGRGAARAIREATRALEDPPRFPDLVAAHATSTPANDAAEYAALSSAFGSGLPGIPVTALKSRIGHTLGAAGAVELAVVIAAMEESRIPAAANAETDRASFPDLDLLHGDGRAGSVERAAVVSLGFGGADAAILVEAGSVSEPTSPCLPGRAVGGSETEVEEVVISGCGVLVPTADQTPIRPGELGLDESRLEGLDDARAVRRLARFSRLVRAAGILAVQDAGLDEDEIRSCAGFVGTRFGAPEYTLDFYQELIRDGLGAGNPLYFAESVPNIGSAQLSLGLGIEGLTLSVGGTVIAGIEAMHLARRHLQTGQSDRAIVVAAEESHPMVRKILDDLGHGSEQPSAEGAVAFVLERADSLRDRGGVSKSVLRGSEVVWPASAGTLASIDSLAKVIPNVTAQAIMGPPAGSLAGRMFDLAIRRCGGPESKSGRSSASKVSKVERGSVGPLLAVADAMGAGASTVIAWPDSAGGAGSLEVGGVSSPS
ncbi:MAG: hypothetical protein CBB69_009245 [Phycisphaera sp. TMED9]|nr:MAG: hypothetical protein CBB69_009245 [Phycisphaera sp. TMED9]